MFRSIRKIDFSKNLVLKKSSMCVMNNKNIKVSKDKFRNLKSGSQLDFRNWWNEECAYYLNRKSKSSVMCKKQVISKDKKRFRQWKRQRNAFFLFKSECKKLDKNNCKIRSCEQNEKKEYNFEQIPYYCNPNLFIQYFEEEEKDYDYSDEEKFDRERWLDGWEDEKRYEERWREYEEDTRREEEERWREDQEDMRREYEEMYKHMQYHSGDLKKRRDNIKKKVLSGKYVSPEEVFETEYERDHYYGCIELVINEYCNMDNTEFDIVERFARNYVRDKIEK